MKVAALYEDKFRIEDRPQPTPAEGEVLLRIKACGVCGTDILKVQKKSVPGGTVLGHEVSGIVESVGEGVSKFKKGDRVVVAHHVPCFECHFCRHENFSMCAQFKSTNLHPGGFSEYLIIPKEHVEHTAFKVPNHLSFEEACFMEPVGCCLRAVERSRLLKGDKVLIIGLGSIGLILTQLFKISGMQVWATDLIDERKNLALSYGAEIFDSAKPLDFDMVLLTGGNYQLFNQSLTWLRNGGTLHFFSSLHREEAEKWTERLDLNQIYHRELTLLSTYSSSPKQLAPSLQLIADGKLDVKKLISKTVPLEGLAESLQQMVSRQILKSVVVP